MKAFDRNARNLIGLLVVLFLFSFIYWTGHSLSIGPATVEAKITEETSPSEENIVFDKSNPHVKKVMDAQNRHTQALMSMPEVVGTAAGLSEDNSPAIVVFTKKKLEAGAIPEYLEGIPVTVVVTGEIFAMKQPDGVKGKRTVQPTSQFTMPVPIGVSTGNINECSAGTIAARLKDGSGNVYALSNNHVYALENNATKKGPNSDGDPIIQPGRYDTGCAFSGYNQIGNLYDFVTINFNGGPNTVDAAIASSSINQLKTSTPSDGYGTPNSLTYFQATGRTPYIGQSVKKYGRTTRLTTGTINGINVTVKVCYNSSCTLIATFVNQLAIGRSNFSKAGDSGSLIVTNDSNAYPIGLLFAGGSGVTFSNPIDAVLNSFSLSVDDRDDK